MSDLKIEYKNTDSLTPYVNNSRTHSDEQVTQVASSIKEFGFTNPILIDEQGGIIAGHGRLMAANKLGLEQVPTITLVGLSEAQRKAYIIADNKLALNSGWDYKLLRLEIGSLESLDFDIELLGFDEQEIDSIFNDSIDIEIDNDDGLTGSDLPKLKFGKKEAEMTDDELASLSELFKQHTDATGSSYGFVSRLING